MGTIDFCTGTMRTVAPSSKDIDVFTISNSRETVQIHRQSGTCSPSTNRSISIDCPAPHRRNSSPTTTIATYYVEITSTNYGGVSNDRLWERGRCDPIANSDSSVYWCAEHSVSEIICA